MTGKSPAWIVDGSGGAWSGAHEVVKTLWIFSRESANGVRIQGRQLDGSERLRFQRGKDEAISDELALPDASKTSVVPGGATPEIMKSYVFVPSYVLYPTRGCWQFDISIGGNNHQIILLLK
jgi:hypothetical protein